MLFGRKEDPFNEPLDLPEAAPKERLDDDLKNVLMMTSMKHYQCMCELCANMELHIEVWNKAATKHGMPRIKSKFDITEATLCDQGEEENHRYACISRECEDCGPQMFREVCGDLPAEEVTWNQWERTAKQVNGKNVTAVGLVTHQGSLDELVGSMEKALQQFPTHLHNAGWQKDQYTLLTDMISASPGLVVSVLDFSENFTCIFQNESQSAHWCKQQITLHPVVCLYQCPLHGKTVRESIVIVSEDLTHDHHAVEYFIQKVTEHLQQHLEITKHIQWSDGCSCQYKSKGPFSDVAFAPKKYKFPVERHYFGSRHGKGPSDGEGGVVKRSATTAVLCGQAVQGDVQLLPADPYTR